MRIVERRPRLLLTSIGSAFVAALAVAEGQLENSPWTVLAVVATVVAVVQCLRWLTRNTPVHRDTSVVIEDRRVVVGGRDRGTPAHGRAVPLPDGRFHVVFSFGWLRDLVLEVERADEARALLASAGFDRREGTTRFELADENAFGIGGLLGGFAIAVLLGLTQTMTVGRLVPWIAAMVVLALSAIALLRRIFPSTEIVVGAEELFVRNRSGSELFARARIRDVRRTPATCACCPDSGGIVLELEDGTTRTIVARSSRGRASTRPADRVFEALSAWLRDDTGPREKVAYELSVSRARRSATEWVATLRSRARAAGGYREPALDPSEMVDVLRDPDAPKDVRVGAAVALHAIDPSRVRIAADEVADPDVRRIAVLAAEGDDEALASAIDEATLDLDRERP